MTRCRAWGGRRGIRRERCGSTGRRLGLETLVRARLLRSAVIDAIHVRKTVPLVLIAVRLAISEACVELNRFAIDGGPLRALGAALRRCAVVDLVHVGGAVLLILSSVGAARAVA